MMHESVTKSPSPANFYQHKSEDILSNNQAKAALSSRDMLPASGGASRRPQSVGLQKRARTMLAVLPSKLIISVLLQLSDPQGQPRPTRTGVVGGGSPAQANSLTRTWQSGTLQMTW